MKQKDPNLHAGFIGEAMRNANSANENSESKELDGNKSTPTPPAIPPLSINDNSIRSKVLICEDLNESELEDKINGFLGSIGPDVEIVSTNLIEGNSLCFIILYKHNLTRV